MLTRCERYDYAELLASATFYSAHAHEMRGAKDEDVKATTIFYSAHAHEMRVQGYDTAYRGLHFYSAHAHEMRGCMARSLSHWRGFYSAHAHEMRGKGAVRRSPRCFSRHPACESAVTYHVYQAKHICACLKTVLVCSFGGAKVLSNM